MKPPRYLDTNPFIRVLTGDDPVKARACLQLFQRLERGQEEAGTDDVVIAEVVYVLTSESLYNLSRDDAVARLRPLVAARGLKAFRKYLILEALDLYAARPELDFTNALIVEKMAADRTPEVYSYDRGFDSIPGIRRVEPKLDREKEAA